MISFARSSVPLYSQLRSFRQWKRHCFVYQNTLSVVRFQNAVFIYGFCSHILVIRDFFLAYSHPLDPPIFKKLLTSCLSAAKSSNAAVRANAMVLFKGLLNTISADSLGSAVSELLTLPQAGKTTGPDHRAALYTMLSVVPPSPAVSLSIVKALPPLILKESNDNVISILASILPQHLSSLMHDNISVPADISNAIAKEMTNVKPVLRKAFVSVAGTALWNVCSLDNDASFAFAKSISTSLEANLKTISTNPLGTAAGPLEGYIALSILLGPMAKSGKFGTNPTSWFYSVIMLMLAIVNNVNVYMHGIYDSRRCYTPYVLGRTHGHDNKAVLFDMGQGIP